MNQRAPANKEIYINLVGRKREDGLMFVTSTNVSFFSSLVEDENWDAVLEDLRTFLEINLGKVKNLRFVEDPPLDGLEAKEQDILPAHVIGEMSRGVGTARDCAR